MKLLIKEAGEYVEKQVPKISIVEFFKAHTDEDGIVTDDVVVFDTVEVKAADESIEWTLSDYSVDRDMERIDPDGWDYKSYKKNPVVLWGHDYTRPAIGKMAAIRKSGTDNALIGKVEFDKDDEFAQLIERKVRSGIISTGSVGFKSLKVEFVEDEDKKEAARLIHRKQELYEFSIVNIPANINAAVRRAAEPEKDKTYIDLLLDGDRETSGQERDDTRALDYLFSEKHEYTTIKELINGD